MGARGEATIRTAQGPVEVLFTNRALAEVEQATGQSTLAVLRGFQRETAGLKELVQLLRAGMQAARRDTRTASGRPVSLDDVYAVLDEAGFAACLAAVVEAVAAVLSHRGEAQEQDPNP